MNATNIPERGVQKIECEYCKTYTIADDTMAHMGTALATELARFVSDASRRAAAVGGRLEIEDWPDYVRQGEWERALQNTGNNPPRVSD